MTLTAASKNGYLDIVQFLDEKGLNVNEMNGAPLVSACSYGHLDVVKYLVEHGANINVKEGLPLHNALLFGYIDVVKYLVYNGAYILDKHLRAAKVDAGPNIYNFLLNKKKKTICNFF